MACILCLEEINLELSDTYVKLTEKGCAGINNANKQRKLDVPDVTFDKDKPSLVHKKCRMKHINPKDIKLSEKRQTNPVEEGNVNRRSTSSEFNFKTHCFLCGAFVEQTRAKKNPNRSNYQFSHAVTLTIQKNILSHCHRRKDDWATAVEARLATVNDLPAEEALYHHVCKDLFVKGKDLPGAVTDEPSTKRRKVGRPICNSKQSALQFVIDYLEENDDETITLNDLHDVMIQKSGLSDEEG